MKRTLIITALALALPATAQVMQPNKDPVPSPSELRGATGEDRPQGQAREDRTPSPSDLAAEGALRIDGDRRTSDLPRSAAAGGSSAGQPIPLSNRGEPIAPR